MSDTFAMKNGSKLGSSEIHHDGEDSVNRDEEELARLGKRQELRRNFGFMSMLGFSCTLMITWERLLTVFVYGLTDGGLAGLIYGYLFCWVGYLAVVASLAEMVSMAPTAGGQYHWTFLFAPQSCRNFLSFITGWQSVLSWQACLASAAYLGGTIIQGLLVLNYPTYNFQRWHGTLLLYAVVLLAMLFNTYLAKQLPKVEGAVLIVHIVGFFGVLITLVYLAPHGTAHDVFALYLNNGGYDKGASFFVGLITTVFAFIGADGAIHMSEEIKNASTVVPYSLVASIGLNGTMGFSMLIAILFCIGNIENALETTTGFPFIEIFYQAVNSTGGATAMTSIVLSLMIFAAIAVLAAASRMMWAFARDNGLPGSRFISRVEPRTKLPLYSVGISVVITLLLGLINIGSSAAFNAVASLVVAGYLGSYTLPMGLLLHKKLFNPSSIHYGPWTLGRRLGIFCNAFGLLWIAITMTFSFFPSVRTDLTLQSMNWSSLIWGGTMLIGVASYFGYLRGKYNGPIVETDIIEQMNGV
ncbi:Choline transport protein [Exophiala dermatitidis]